MGQGLGAYKIYGSAVQGLGACTGVGFVQRGLGDSRGCGTAGHCQSGNHSPRPNPETLDTKVKLNRLQRGCKENATPNLELTFMFFISFCRRCSEKNQKVK